MKTKNIYIFIMVIMFSLLFTHQAFANTVDPTVSVKDFGAKGDSISDDAGAIQKALDTGGSVYFPAGTYLIKRNLIIRDGNNLKGIPGSSKILINNSFVRQANYNPMKEGAITNESFAWEFNAATADSFSIYGLTFEHTQTVSTIDSTLLFGNIDGVKIENSTFIANGTVYTNNLDLYVVCKNVLIKDSTFENTTQATAGGAIWIRNMTDDPYNQNNVTTNISVYNSNFKKRSNDEIIAVFGHIGPVKKVNITNNKFDSFGYASDVVLSIFSGTPAANKGASVEDVIFKGNTVTVEDFNAHVLMIGRKTNPDGVVNNITIEENVFNIKVKKAGYQDVISTFDFTNIKNVTIRKNTINNTGTELINTAIRGGDTVSDNKTNGSFKYKT